jgi:hypothetical protein
MRCRGVLPTGLEQGFIEVVPNAVTESELQKERGTITGVWATDLFTKSRVSQASVASPHLPNKNDFPHYTFLSLFKVLTIGCNASPESLHPFEKNRTQSPFFDPHRNHLTGREKFIGRLKDYPNRQCFI